jgi:hypothetical protein
LPGMMLAALPEVVACAAGATSTAAIAMGTTTAAAIRRNEVSCMVFTTPNLCDRFGTAEMHCRRTFLLRSVQRADREARQGGGRVRPPGRQ